MPSKGTMSKFWTKLITFAIGSLGLSLTGQTAPAPCPVIIYNPSTTLELTDLKMADVRRGTAPTMASQAITKSKLTIMLNGTGGKTWA